MPWVRYNSAGTNELKAINTVEKRTLVKYRTANIEADTHSNVEKIK
jgi:hypothetical protein